MLRLAETPFAEVTRPEMVLTVLGGSSPATPVLIESLRKAQLDGAIGALELRLFGRNELQLQRICDYSRAISASHVGRALQISTHCDIGNAVRGASHILCMIRAGGMEGRAYDERLALSAGVPADEGLAVGGLSCFLRTRNLITEIAEQCARYAPRAWFMQMASPLGLNVALSRAAFGSRSFGLCELPRVTAATLRDTLCERGGPQWASHAHAGLNHQSWLYAFRDERDRDITQSVLDALPAKGMTGIDKRKMLEFGAVPVSYLEQYLHTRRVLNAQRNQSVRGVVLSDWSQRVSSALCSGLSVHVPKVGRLLAQRKMDWFEQGVIPVLAALGESRSRLCVLNVPAAEALPGVSSQAIVEINCRVSARGVTAMPVAPMPSRAASLTQQLVTYEAAALGLPQAPSAERVSSVLELHPLVPRTQIGRLARALASGASSSG
jgi:6-phospho-beta-glucosidase